MRDQGSWKRGRCPTHEPKLAVSGHLQHGTLWVHAAEARLLPLRAEDPTQGGRWISLLAGPWGKGSRFSFPFRAERYTKRGRRHSSRVLGHESENGSVMAIRYRDLARLGTERGGWPLNARWVEDRRVPC